MKVELNTDDLKIAVVGYLSNQLNIEAHISEVEIDGYSKDRAATWEKKEVETDGE